MKSVRVTVTNFWVLHAIKLIPELATEFFDDSKYRISDQLELFK